MIAAFVEILFRTLKSMEYLVELYSIQSRLNQAWDGMTINIDGKSKQKIDSRSENRFHNSLLIWLFLGVGNIMIINLSS